VPRRVGELARRITERFSSTWKLLSETTSFLAKTSVFPQYEHQLRELRSRLYYAQGDDRITTTVRKQIIELRASLRLQGYDLSLGSLSLSVHGSRGDESLSEGYRRLVIFIGEAGIRALAGTANHLELHDMLEAHIAGKGDFTIRQKHYLWYRWLGSTLSLSAAATESASEFERFKAWCDLPENRLALLSAIKTVHTA
jgi:hypothetical protein